MPNQNKKPNQRFANRRGETSMSKYEKAVDDFKRLLEDKIHPKNRTAAYKKNTISIINRLMTSAEALELEDPGAGTFGLIILGLMSSLALKDKNIELEVQIRDMERRVRRLEKR